ncbi:MAG: ATP-binding protein [bacterium]
MDVACPGNPPFGRNQPPAGLPKREEGKFFPGATEAWQPRSCKPLKIAEVAVAEKGQRGASASGSARRYSTGRFLHDDVRSITGSPIATPATGHAPAEPSSAIFLVDPAGRIAGWSPHAARLSGYTAAEVIGADLTVLYPPATDAGGHPASELAAAATSGRAEAQTWLVQKSGGRVWAETILTAMRDEAGRIASFTFQARDLSQHKEGDARRRARTEQLAVLARTREEVAAFSVDLAALLARIALRAREITGADATVIELRDGVGALARAHDGVADLDLTIGSLLMPHGGATVGARLQALRYDTSHESPEILGDVCDRSGVGSVLAIPILNDRATIGWIVALARSSDAFDDQRASTLAMVSTLVGGPIAQAQAAETRRSLLAERARAQAAHRESEARFRAAMDASLDALFILGAVRSGDKRIIDFTLLDANRRAEELCDLPHGAYAGRRLHSLPGAAGRLAPFSVLANVVETSQPIEQERASVDVGGRTLWIQEQIVPLGDGVTVTVRDVTARVEADAEVRRAREAAEAANLAKTEFVAKMSHELRTPLNSVIGFSKILLRNKRNTLDEKELAYLSRVTAAGTHLLALVNDVLDIAKVESGHMSLELGPVDIVALSRTVMAQLESSAQSAGLAMSLMTTVEGLVVVADAAKLQQVLLNLVGNAIKFTPTGGIAVRVLTPDTEHPVIEIADSGIGIAPDRLEAVFAAFEQAESSTSRRYGGSGLGLSISRALCEAMGFKLRVESALGEGATFRVEM